MKKTIFLYGLSLAGLVILLKYFEYRLFVKDLALEAYVGAVALLFTALGVWVGLRLTRKKTVVTAPEVQFDETAISRLGISKREKDVLQLITQGLSNQEIADKLFVSVNTVKTHSSNLFQKLDVSRRTQAVQKAKELGLVR